MWFKYSDELPCDDSSDIETCSNVECRPLNTAVSG